MRTKEYLKNIMELEQAVYTINKAVGYLQYKSRNLGIRKNYTEPQKPVKLDGLGTGVFALYDTLKVAALGIPISIVFGLIRWIYGGKFGASFWGCMLLFIGIGFFKELFENSYMNDYTSSKYNEEVSHYYRLVEEDKKRVSIELAQKEDIESQITTLVKKRKEISETLNKLYDINIIYPKYRNFVAVTTFYEYFESGRCNELQGHEGAYNIYENEIRLNVIITKLDDIIERLDEIRSNQYAIHNAVSEGNRIANNIYQQAIKTSGKMDLISENSAITSYNSMITAKNSEILKNIAVYNILKE